MLNMNEVRRIVVKVGSSTLTYDNGKPNIRRIERLVRTISDLQNRGFAGGHSRRCAVRCRRGLYGLRHVQRTPQRTGLFA